MLGSLGGFLIDRFGDLGTLAREVMHLAWRVRAWWLPPLILVLLGAAWLAATGQIAAPFVYTLF